VFPHSFLQRFDLSREFSIGGEELPRVDESPHHLDARTDGQSTLENVREHDYAVFREHV
jgi:hypothetical protein